MTSGNGKENGLLFEQKVEDDVPIEQMFFADDNRPVSKSHVEELIKDWNPNYVRRIALSMRDDGKFRIIDGGHRVTAAMRLGIKSLPADVYLDLTEEQEARVARYLNKTRRETALDNYRHKIKERDKNSLEIRSALRRYGLDISMSGASGFDHRTCAIAALEEIHSTYGLTALTEIISILEQTWGGEARAYTGTVLLGMAAFYDRYFKHPFDRNDLVGRLKKHTANETFMLARNRRDPGDAVYTSFGKYVRLVYNANRPDHGRAYLPDWKRHTYSEETKKNMSESAKRAVEKMRSEGFDFSANARKGAETKRAKKVQSA